MRELIKHNQFKIKMSIYNKLILYITALIIAAVGANSYLSIKSATKRLAEDMIHQGWHFTGDIEFGAQKAFSSLNWVFVENMLSELVRDSQNGVVFARILKPNGEIYMADDRDVYGDIAPEDLLLEDDTVIDNYYCKSADSKCVLIVHPFDIGNEKWEVVIGLSYDLIVASIKGLVKQDVIMGLFVILLGLGVSFVLARSITNPIVELAKAAEIISQEDLSYQVDIDSHDEIGLLAISFNNMALRLRDSYGELEEKVKQRTNDLEQTIAKLNESNQQLKDFTYIASHDLREPLRKVSSFGMILKESLGDKLSGDDLESFNFMIDGAERMNGMIEGLLMYSRVSTKAQPSEVIDVNESLGELKKFELAALIEDTGALIEACGELGSVEADPVQLRQLLQNLIANGIKYQKAGNVAHIMISSKATANGMLRIEVSDNGIGIKPEFYENIFVMFKRLHARGEYEGTGIGLAVCKKIVDRHGGSIGVEAGEDGGSVFWFTMPCAEVKAAAVV